MELVGSEDLEKQYAEILVNLDNDTAEKFKDFVNNLKNNIACLADYGELDVNEWGDLIY